MFQKNWTWTLLGVLAITIRYFAVKSPEKTEDLYSRIFFPGVRNIIDLSISRFPFPTVYLFVALILVFIGIFFYQLIYYTSGWKRKLEFTFRSFFNGVGALVFFFLVLWGFNYQRIPIFEQLSLDPKAMNEDVLLGELNLTRNILTQLRGNLQVDTSAIEDIPPYRDLEDIVRAEMRKNLYLLGLNFTGYPRTKEFFPGGLMRRMGIYGIYFPYTGESYIDPSLHALEKPFTIAHEMAHSYGVTDEGEANFIGWVICSNSEYPLLQYSGQLRLFRYQLSDLYRINQESYSQFIGTIPRGVRNDLVSVRMNMNYIQPLSMELSKRSNDLYLRTQGVKAGVNSYAQLPMLALAWRNQMISHLNP